MAAAAGFAWSIPNNASGGSVTSAGVYSAGSTGGVTDVVQVVVLVVGGLFLSYASLDMISGVNGVVAGFHALTSQLPERST